MTAIFLVPVFMGLGFWILLIALIVVLIRGTRPTSAASGGGAVHLLEKRYARGEITREDFLERRAVLGGTAPAPGEDAL